MRTLGLVMGFLANLEKLVRPEPIEGLHFTLKAAQHQKKGGASTSSARTEEG
jgi:hypothetical protein